jgi:ABC-type transport system substrate-binding protein
VDRARGEVLLTRNDQYWDTPATLDQLLLRHLDGVALADGLGVGDVDVALPEPTPAVRTALSGITPPPRTEVAPRPIVTDLALRTDAGPLADTRVRQALAILIDREAVRAAAAPEAPAADAFGLAPSEPGYAPTVPSTRPSTAGALLRGAGWTRDDEGRWRTADGEPARLVVGAPAERATDLAVAANVAAQLDAAGIEVTVVAPSGVELYSAPTVPPIPPSTPASPTASTTPNPTAGTTAHASPAVTATPTATGTATPAAGVAVDIAVRPRTVGGDPASDLASAFGCTGTLPARPGVSGTCSEALQPLLDDLVSDPDGPDAAAHRDAVEKLLWEQVPALPLFQPVTLVVSTPGADAVTDIGPGPLVTGPLTGAQRWTEPPR